MNAHHGDALPDDVTAVLRELVNAIGKSGMYPAGHRFIEEALNRLTEVMAASLESRGPLTLGFTPRNLLLDGTTVEPLPAPIRQFSQRMHRRNIGTIQLTAGVSRSEVASMLQALTDPDAEDQVGMNGLRSQHIRIEPLVYEVLAFGHSEDEELDDLFWSRLVEAAFDQRLSGQETSPANVAEAINNEATRTHAGARRVFEALSAFASALHSRGDRAPASARRRFVEVLSALSRPATTRVMEAAPSRPTRRRFMRETLEQVPPSLLLQLLESVAEADGDPISGHLRLMLGKLAGGAGAEFSAAEGDFATEIMTLLEQWDGAEGGDDNVGDPRLAVESFRLLAIGLEIGAAAPGVVRAARDFAAKGHLDDALRMLAEPGNDPEVEATIAAAILDPGLLDQLLGEAEPDWDLISRIVRQVGANSVAALLNRIDIESDRSSRRRILDLLVTIGPAAEATLVASLEGAPWHLKRNILSVLARLPGIAAADRIVPFLTDAEPRVRLEALKVALRQPATLDVAVSEALESGEPQLARMALSALGGECPPTLVAAVLSSLGIADEDVQLQAIRLVGETENPLVVPPLLGLVRERRGFLRRWHLLPTSAPMLAALTALARRWSNHRPVLMTLQLAMKSDQPEVRRALGLIE